MKPGRRAKKDDEFGRARGIELGWLKSQAYVWNMILHSLREGNPGFIAKIKNLGPGKQKLEPVMDYLEFFDLLSHSARRRRGMARTRDRKVDVIVASIVLPQKLDDTVEFVRGNKGFVFTPPQPPRPELWEQFKNARSVVDVQRIARKLHLGHHISVAHWVPIHFHAQDLLSAKQLHNYPRSKRVGSDEKRIHFFAKVLSGLMQGASMEVKVRLRINGKRRTIRFHKNEGIAPATATKRLARLALPRKSDFRKDSEEHAAWYSQPVWRKTPMQHLVRYERERGTTQWYAVLEDQTGRTWREKGLVGVTGLAERSHENGPV
jgi:hypothetical protein